MTTYRTMSTELTTKPTYLSVDMDEFNSYICEWCMNYYTTHYVIQLWLEGYENVIQGRVESEEIYECYEELTGEDGSELDELEYYHTEEMAQHVFVTKYYNQIKLRIQAIENEQ